MKSSKLRKTAALLAVLLSLGSLLLSCKQGGGTTNDTGNPGTSDIPSESQGEAATGSPTAEVTPDTIPESQVVTQPTQGSYTSPSEARITFGDIPTVEGKGAVAEDHAVTVTSAGTYLVSGSTANGQIVVDTADADTVTLVLNGVSLTCTDGPAVYVKSAPKKVVLYTAAGSVNLLSDTAGYVVADEEQVEGEVYPNACVYACDDLTLDGEGELTIRGNADKGINTKDDLALKGGNLTVTSAGVGLRGNDSVTITGGKVTVTSGGDGIKSANTATEGKGYVNIEGGELYVTATGDGISAATDLSVSGGLGVIVTKDADNSSLSADITPSYDMLRGPGGSMPPGGMPPGGFGGGMGGGMTEGNSNKSTISAKGLKAVGTLSVTGGKLTVTSADDGIHSDDAVWIKDGSLYISAADDGIHANNTLTVSGGITEIVKSYEGLEANQITVSGGTNRVTASDDGVNANGGTSMGMGGFPRASTDASASTDTPDPLLTVSGGYTVVNANGDGIDSNGNIVMTGGVLYVYGPTNNGNGPIDVGDGAYKMTVSGGTFLAVGSNGMAESAENAGQAVFAAKMNTLQAGTLIGIKNADGDMIAAFELPKAIASVVFSSPALTAGNTYTLVYGGSAGEAVDGVVDVTTYTGYVEMGSLQAY